jgi:hypothetical protein
VKSTRAPPLKGGVGAVAEVAALVDHEVEVDEADGAAADLERRLGDPVAAGAIGGALVGLRAVGADEAVAAGVGPDAGDGRVGEGIAGGEVDDLAVEGAGEGGRR